MISQGNFVCPKHWSLVYFTMLNYIYTNIPIANISSQNIVLYGCNSVNGCISNALPGTLWKHSVDWQRTSYAREIIFKVYSNHPCSWTNPHVPMWDILVGCNLLPCWLDAQQYCVFLQTVLPELLEDVRLALWWIVVPAWWNPTTPWGKCPIIVRYDVPRVVDWAWWPHCLTCLVIWPHAIGYLPVGTLEYWTSHSENLCCSCNCWRWGVALWLGKKNMRHTAIYLKMHSRDKNTCCKHVRYTVIRIEWITLLLLHLCSVSLYLVWVQSFVVVFIWWWHVLKTKP